MTFDFILSYFVHYANLKSQIGFDKPDYACYTVTIM